MENINNNIQQNRNRKIIKIYKINKIINNNSNSNITSNADQRSTNVHNNRELNNIEHSGREEEHHQHNYNYKHDLINNSSTIHKLDNENITTTTTTSNSSINKHNHINNNNINNGEHLINSTILINGETNNNNNNYYSSDVSVLEALASTSTPTRLPSNNNGKHGNYHLRHTLKKFQVILLF